MELSPFAQEVGIYLRGNRVLLDPEYVHLDDLGNVSMGIIATMISEAGRLLFPGARLLSKPIMLVEQPAKLGIRLVAGSHLVAREFGSVECCTLVVAVTGEIIAVNFAKLQVLLAPALEEKVA